MALPHSTRRFTFESFVVGKPNEFAYACARRVAEQPSSPGFNPLFLYGGVGLGKTHLMHAIAWELVGNGDREGRPGSVAYMSAEKFMYRFIAAIRSQSTMEFKEQLRSVDVLMVDDLQFLIGKDRHAGRVLPHVQCAGRRRQADRRLLRQVAVRPVRPRGPAAHAARLRHGGGPPRHDVRAAHLDPGGQGRATPGSPVPHKVLEFLAHKITTNVRELEGALNRLDRRTPTCSAARSRSKRRRKCCTTCSRRTTAG